MAEPKHRRREKSAPRFVPPRWASALLAVSAVMLAGHTAAPPARGDEPAAVVTPAAPQAPAAPRPEPSGGLTCAVPAGSKLPPPGVIDDLFERAGVLEKVEEAGLDQMERDILYAYGRDVSLAKLQRRFAWLTGSDAAALKATLAACPERQHPIAAS